MKLKDKVRLLPPVGCCNSTLCFQEWEIIGLFEIVNKTVRIPMVIVESDGHTDVFRKDRVELIPQG